MILKFIWKGKEPTKSKSDLKMKNKIGRLTLSDFSIYYSATVIKTVCGVIPRKYIVSPKG